MPRPPRTAGRESAPSVVVRHASAEQAIVVWEQLRRGEWAVVDRFDDSAGRRLVIARKASQVRARAWHSLSPRERSVVAAVAAGQSNRQIAEQLQISVSTVGGHLRSACAKLGGARRLDLVREWSAAGDTEGDDPDEQRLG